MPEPLSRRRSLPYPGAGVVLAVPTEVWNLTIRNVRAYGAEHSEALVFWGGIVTGEGVLVTGLYLPEHKPQGGCVRLSKEESRWLLRRLCERDEKLLAQIHSHPGDAFHSGGDDAGSASFHAGYMSLIVPGFGTGIDVVSRCEAVEFDGSGFVPLSRDELDRRIVVFPMVEKRADRPPPLQRERGWWRRIASSLRPKHTARRRL
jgi:hypothetical protein